ncbi:peptidase S58 family protein, partial [Nonomuraea sp. MG754425]|uniref:P1 family peptidase n=1 Tax=Nonomuraea sp. MG754425 TaxID=2570319 RepID=UPI001F1A1134
MPTMRAGATNSLRDVPGLRVGHAQRVGGGFRTGTTVVLAPASGAVAGVDVRGAAPGTRETELLDPRNLVERVHAVVLSGGSAFGLSAACGVMARLADAGSGYPVAGGAVPIVPAAVIFDLGRGGAFRAVPDAALGAAAYDAALAPLPDAADARAGVVTTAPGTARGSVGAGT